MSSPRSPHRLQQHHAAALDDSFDSDANDSLNHSSISRGSSCASESEDEVFFGTCSDAEETEEEAKARIRCEQRIREKEEEEQEAAAAAAAAEAAAAALAAAEAAAEAAAMEAAVQDQPATVPSPSMEDDAADPEPTEADAAGSILTQVRATILKLKQGRSTIGVAPGPAGKVTKLTLTGASSLPVLRTATSGSRIPTPAASAANSITAIAVAQKPAAINAQPSAALTLSRAQPAPAAAAAAPVASQARAPIATAAPAAAPVAASKLSTLASNMQLASPAPMRKTMSVFRTATIQAQVAALNKSTQQQQMAAAAAVAAAPAKPAQPAALPSARPASASVSSAPSTSAAPLLLSARPVSASAAVTSAAPAAPATALSFRTPARRTVVWRDEDASQSAHLGPLAGQLEEVKFMSPTLSPEKDSPPCGGASGASLSQSYAAFTAARARSKPMPDLSKTPTKSCLRRAPQGAATVTVAAPIMPVPLSYMQGFASLASASLDAPIATPAPVSVVGVSTTAQRILHAAPSTAGATHSGVQSGARRVPNLTKVSGVNSGVASVGGVTGALRTLSLAPAQPQAAAFPSVAAAAGSMMEKSGNVGAAVTNAYLMKKPLGSSLNTLSANSSGLSNIR